MVVILLDKQIIILLNNQVFISYDLGLFHLLQKLIVYVCSFLNESQLGRVAMSHSPVKLSLKQERNYEPVHRNKTVSLALYEKHYDCHNYRKRHFEYQVHVPEKSENQFQVHVLQMNYFTLRDSIPTLTRYSQWFWHQFSRQSRLNPDCQLMEKSFGMLSKK